MIFSSNPSKRRWPLLDDLRRKRPVTVTRPLKENRAVIGVQRLRGAAVAAVPTRVRARRGAPRIPQVLVQLGAHRALDESLRQLRQQPSRPRQLLRRLSAGEQLVDQLIRQQAPQKGTKRPARHLSWVHR